MSDLTITPNLRRLLDSAKPIANGHALVIHGKLEPDQYQELANAIKLMGGTWKKGKVTEYPDLAVPGRFQFDRDIRSLLETSLRVGVIPDAKKRRQAFYTPDAVVERVLSFAQVMQGSKVLEPSAGGGALARAARDQGADVLCVEIDDFEASKLKADDFEVINDDFLQVAPVKEFDFVLMNPPFTKGQDAQHVAHALEFLRLGGRLVAIVSAGFSGKELIRLGELLGPHNVELETVDAGAFKESGTNVATLILILDNYRRGSRFTDEDIEGMAHRDAVGLIHGDFASDNRNKIGSMTKHQLLDLAAGEIMKSYGEQANRAEVIDNGLGWRLAVGPEHARKIANLAAEEVVAYFTEDVEAPV